jgi:hypothetical protein
VRSADVKWIFLSCVIPDLPWILRRAIVAFFDQISAYDILLYAIVQASFLGCLLISACIAVFSRMPRRVFLLLATGSLFHLLYRAPISLDIALA